MGNKKRGKGDDVHATPEPDHESEPAQVEAEPEAPADRLFWYAEVVGVFAVVLGFFWYLQTLSDYVIACDSYFHAKMALLIRQHGWAVKDFPWTTTSIFKDHFSDSSFLYHLCLIPFTFMSDEVTAIKLGAAVWDAVFFTIFYVILRTNRCRLPFLFVILLASCGSLFLYRLTQNRGYLLSMCLALLTVEACINHRHRLLFAVAVAYPLSYTAFQVVVVIPIIHCMVQFLNGEKWDRKLVPIAAGGALVGLVIHPNFPRDFYMWWVQNVQVMWFKWTSTEQIFFGGELYPPELKYLTHSTTALFVTLIVCGVATAFSTRPRRTSTLTMFAVTLFFGMLTLASKRFIEYSAPFGIAYAAFLFRDLVGEATLDHWMIRWPSAFKLGSMGVAAGVGVLLWHSYADIAKDLKNERDPGLKPAALWLKEHAQKDDIVYTADWDDFPQLWYYNSDQRYLICLDPMFFYTYDHDLWKLWTETSNVRTQDVYNAITLRFHAKWVLATNDFQNLIKKCGGDPRFRKVFANNDVTVFEVLPDLPGWVKDWSISAGYTNDLAQKSEALVLEHVAKPELPLPPAGGVAMGLEWRPWTKEKGSWIDLEQLVGPFENEHAYAACTVDSPVEQEAELKLGFDDAVKLWVNGAEIFEDKGPTEAQLDGKSVKVKLPKGRSTLCVRCMNYKGNWGFMLRFFAKQECSFAPLTK